MTLVLSVLLVSGAFAQTLEISGVVTEATSGDPLPGANISIKGTNLGAATDRDGKFSIRLPNFSEATLVISFIGFVTEELDVTSSTSNLSVALNEDVLKVSEIVITGLATSVKKRNLANSVGTVSSKELIPAPAQTLERALNGKIAGIDIKQNTGAPGGGINVNLRGLSTLTGETQPLYVIDGVIISNAAVQSGIDVVTEATGAGSDTPQGQPSNRIADLNPNDIENIEVLKGASAAAIYGSKASNGVVIITTKSGAAGRTRIDITQQLGFNTILNKVGTRRFTAETALENNGQQGLDLFNASGGKFIDQEEVLFGQEGFISETSIGIRGGSETTQFYVGGLVLDEDGIVKNSGYQKLSGRVNVNHKISDRLKVDVFTNFVRTESDRSITGNDNTNTTLGFSSGFTPSYVDIENPAPIGNLETSETGFPILPFNPSNPAETVALFENRETVYRMLGSIQASWNIIRTQQRLFDFTIQTGIDFYSMEHFIYAPNELQWQRSRDLPGESINGETESIFSNLNAHLSHSYTTEGNIMFRTTAGLQFENRNLNNVFVNSNGLVSTQSNVDQATSVDVFQTRDKERTRGFFAQQEVDLNEKIFLTAAVRGDASSANGDTDKYFLFPKFSGSLRLSEYSFWSGLSSFSPEFKLRAAYGETGTLPSTTAKFANLVTNNIGGRTGLVLADERGDPDIQPERTKEIEFGFDATIFNGHGTLEVSHYRQNISDLIIDVQIAPSQGNDIATTNAGEMRTTGWEISLGLNPIRSSKFNWNTRLNFFTTDSEITQLDVDPFNSGGFATVLGTMRVEEGLSPTTIVGAETNPDGSHKILGNGTPDFVMSLNNNLSIGNFDLSFLWDWRQGGDLINLDKLIRAFGGTLPDQDEEIVVEGETKKLGDFLAESFLTRTEPFVEDGTYLKLREASLSYNVPSTVVNRLFGGQISYLRLGLAGRNLLMFTDYKGYDPEVSQFGNVALGAFVDTAPYPSSRSFYFNIAFGI
ncbi:SusC/RagA family TonB-linked outer membrane protein [bacterium]|nr:SusC/RagA family TonB-linked outer membrane protein [bacterium]